MANDGETVWSINREKFNPPRMMTLTHYYFAFLPWLTQDASVNVRSLGQEALPGKDVAYPKLEISWDVGPEDVSGRMFMYVDPETHLLSDMTLGTTLRPPPRRRRALSPTSQAVLYFTEIGQYDSRTAFQGAAGPRTGLSPPGQGNRHVHTNLLSPESADTGQLKEARHARSSPSGSAQPRAVEAPGEGPPPRNP